MPKFQSFLMAVAICAASLLTEPSAAQSAILKAGETFLTSSSGTAAMTSADVDLDGHLDLVIANVDPTVSIFYGNGQGAFPIRQDVSTGPSPVAVAVGDLDGDGIMDLAVANRGDNTVEVFSGRKNGGFRALGSAPIGYQPRSLLFRAGTGRERGGSELLVTTEQDVEIFSSRGRGGIVSSAVYPFGAGFGEVLSGDFDGDHGLDLLGVSTATLAIMHGRSDGGFDLHQDLYSLDTVLDPQQFWWAAAGDLTGDGTLDLAAGTYHFLSNSVTLSVWTSATIPGTPVVSPDLALPVAVGDLNGDGSADVIVVKSHSQGCALFLGDGEGGLTLESEYETGGKPFKAEIGDFDEDGGPDVAILNYDSRTVSILLNAIVSASPRTAMEHVQLRAYENGGAREPVPIIRFASDPNPMTRQGQIHFDLSRAVDVSVNVFDAAGRRVSMLASGRMDVGSHNIQWRNATPGIYFIQLRAGDTRAVRTVVAMP